MVQLSELVHSKGDDGPNYSQRLYPSHKISESDIH